MRVSKFQCGTKYSFKLERRIEGRIECRIEGRIVGRIIYTIQASKYGCHILLFDIVIQFSLGGGKKCIYTSPMNTDNHAFYTFRIHNKYMQTFLLY